MSDSSDLIEARFLAAVIKDDTLDRLNQCRALSPEVFDTWEYREVWREVRKAETYEAVALGRARKLFAIDDALGTHFRADLEELFIRSLRTIGLARVDEWRATLPKPANEWAAVTAAQIADEPPETPPELIHGMLYAGGTLMMSGASKSMKTYTMIAAALGVASGADWLGMRCTARPVVYLNLELQEFAMTARIRAVACALDIAPPSDLHVVNLRGKLVNISTLEANLGRLLERIKPGLVIVDPHYKISAASGVEENSNDAQGLLLYRLENLVCRSGAALMIAHHFSKGDKSQSKAIDRAAGGGALARWPDVVMTLTEHEEPDCATVEFSLRNFAPIPPFVVRWKYPVWSRDGTVNPALLKKAGRINEHPASELLSQLKEGMSGGEWREASGWSEGTYRRRRDELLKAGKVRQSSGCFYLNAP